MAEQLYMTSLINKNEKCCTASKQVAFMLCKPFVYLINNRDVDIVTGYIINRGLSIPSNVIRIDYYINM